MWNRQSNDFSFHFSGFLKDSSQKECVLIIDRVTGEITLEKLSGNMLLKKTRQAKTTDKSEQMDRLLPSTASASSSSNNQGNSSRPQTPVSSFKRESPGLFIFDDFFVYLMRFRIFFCSQTLQMLWLEKFTFDDFCCFAKFCSVLKNHFKNCFIH